MNFERSTYRTIIAALAFLLIGALALVIGSHIETAWISVLTINIGSFIMGGPLGTLLTSWNKLAARQSEGL